MRIIAQVNFNFEIYLFCTRFQCKLSISICILNINGPFSNVNSKIEFFNSVFNFHCLIPIQICVGFHVSFDVLTDISCFPKYPTGHELNDDYLIPIDKLNPDRPLLYPMPEGKPIKWLCPVAAPGSWISGGGGARPIWGSRQSCDKQKDKNRIQGLHSPVEKWGKKR